MSSGEGRRMLPNGSPDRFPVIPRPLDSPRIGPAPDPSPDGSPWGWGDLWAPASACLPWSDAPRGRGTRRRPPAPLRYVGVRPVDSSPVDGPPSSAHFGRDCGGRTIGPALRAGPAIARNLRKPTCGYAAIPSSTSMVGECVLEDVPRLPIRIVGVAATRLKYKRQSQAQDHS
jgi:hypothetical protein